LPMDSTSLSSHSKHLMQHHSRDCRTPLPYLTSWPECLRCPTPQRSPHSLMPPACQVILKGKAAAWCGYTVLCPPFRLTVGHFGAPWTPPFSYYSTFICQMHSYFSLTSLFDRVNGGVCQCIIFLCAFPSFLCSCYSTVQSTVTFGILYLYGTVA
jgi:hypothetical protein